MNDRDYLILPYVALDWDIEKEYNKLDIVRLHGNYYIAITFVPAGIRLSDNNYWCRYA